jgi:hypothetical protein
VQAWLEGDWRDALTAIELLQDEDRENRRHSGGSPVMSG